MTQDAIKTTALGKGRCRPWKTSPNHWAREFRNCEYSENGLKGQAQVLGGYAPLTLRNPHPVEKSMNDGGPEGPLKNMGLAISGLLSTDANLKVCGALGNQIFFFSESLVILMNKPHWKTLF